MEKSELEGKYHKLAAEYSKVKSQATVLKKAVLDEQATILSLKEIIKEQEQKVRKHGQEMESLTFRNEQLTKRIGVLQQELQINGSHGKKGKSKNASDGPAPSNFSVIDEELHKKIIENAHLVSEMADKDVELQNYKDKLEWLESRFRTMQSELDDKTVAYDELNEKHKSATKVQSNGPTLNNLKVKECENCRSKGDGKSIAFWQQEVDRWKTECDLLRSRPQANEELSDFYENQIRDLLESVQRHRSEAGILAADCDALKVRLQNTALSNDALECILERCNEELTTTSQNYKTQLDAMTEHLAAQNEKIAKQCDEVQILRHRLGSKK